MKGATWQVLVAATKSLENPPARQWGKSKPIKHMKTKRILKLSMIGMILPVIVYAQGEFQNLNFEAATISQNQAPGPVNATDALPGWNVYFNYGPIGEVQFEQTQIAYSSLDPGYPQVTLFGTNGVDGTAIEGGFSVLLQAMNLPGLQLDNIAISQIGLVPTSAQCVFFKAQPGTESFRMLLGGQNIPFTAVTTLPNYTLYRGDISAFAGQSLELKFTASVPIPSSLGWNLDSIEFSSQPIPEPSAMVLLTSAGALLLIRQRR